MKVHYFQRYHQKENVATANTMLLLSRLYQYSPDKFYHCLGVLAGNASFSPQMDFRLQEKNKNSVPDATISQESFKIVVETKTSEWFYKDQLIRHLESFGNEQYKILLTIAPVLMDKVKMQDFMASLNTYNEQKPTPILHINSTFENIASFVQGELDERDYEMQDILDDYIDCCNSAGLIQATDVMRVQLAGNTIDFNITEGVYYDNADNGFRHHEYLGLYAWKSVRAIGKISAMIVAVEESNGIHYDVEFGDLTEERKAIVQRAMNNAHDNGWNIRQTRHRYFFVEQFYETDFVKSTKYAPRHSRIFYLKDVLGIKELPSVDKIAELLKDKTWE